MLGVTVTSRMGRLPVASRWLVPTAAARGLTGNVQDVPVTLINSRIAATARDDCFGS
jgi:hypothetical protein